MIKDNKPNLGHFKTYIEDKEIKKLRSLISKYYTIDIVEQVVNKLDINEIIKFLRIISMEDAADIFNHLDSNTAEKIIDKFKSKEIKYLLEEIVSDNIVEFIEEWPANIVDKVLGSVSKDKRKDINLILRYEEDKVGYHMSVDHITLSKTMTIKSAVDHIKKRKSKIPNDTLPFTYFVIDDKKNLIGYVDYESLLFESGSSTLDKVVKPAIHVNTRDDIEHAIDTFKKYELETLVVLNSQNKLVGMLDSVDIMNAIEEEYMEDIDKFAGISESEKNYLTASPMSIVKSRSLWLVALLFVGTITQFIISLFTQNIWKMGGSSTATSGIVSTAFITAIAVVPIMIDSGGNAGGQSSATIIRSLSLKEVQVSDWKKIARKEIIVAIIIGIMMFIANFFRMVFVDLIMYSGYTNMKPGVTVDGLMVINLISSFALFISMILAKFFGSMAPLLARRMNLDEASVSSPIITTILDILIVFVYFGLITLAALPYM